MALVSFVVLPGLDQIGQLGAIDLVALLGRSRGRGLVFRSRAAIRPTKIHH